MGLGYLTPTGEKTSPLREARHLVFIKLTLKLNTPGLATGLFSSPNI